MTPEAQRIAIAEACGWTDPDVLEIVRSQGWSLYPVKKGHNTYIQMCRWNKVEKRQEKMWLHRFALNAPPKIMVCHLNGNAKDNRRCNLAFGNHRTNGSSVRTKLKSAASRFRGVHLNSGRGKRWTVQFIDGGQSIYLGRFDNEIDAAKAYDAEASHRFGKFAHLNFP
jgi:hypothetical protein